MIGVCNWNQLYALVVSITGGLGDSTTLGHKDCENLWNLLDLCLTCGNQVILPTTFPPKKWMKTMKTFTTQSSVKKIHSFTTYCVTRCQQPKGPTNLEKKKKMKWNIRSPIRNDRNSFAKDMGFVVSVFTMTFPWKISISATRASETSRRKISRPYPGQLMFTKSWRENRLFDVFLKIRRTWQKFWEKKQLENLITATGFLPTTVSNPHKDRNAEVELGGFGSLSRQETMSWSSKNLLRSTFEKENATGTVFLFSKLDAKF